MLAVGASMIDLESFLDVTGGLNTAILENVGWLFSLTSLAMVLTCLIVFLSPLGRTRIGGENARPMLSAWRWFSITLCTTVAVGIMFWSTAEPLYHLHSPRRHSISRPTAWMRHASPCRPCSCTGPSLPMPSTPCPP